MILIRHAFVIGALTLSPMIGIGPSRTVAGAQATSQPTRLSAAQIDNLVLLGKVWGFAKYHHPKVAIGGLDWDAELRRILPSVSAARTRVAATTILARWLAALDSSTCSPCVSVPDSAHLRPDIAWIRDHRALGRSLSATLVRIYNNRWPKPAQQYVAFAPNVGNPVFTNENAYAEDSLPASDLRLLALYRFWNIIEYWFPYRDLIEEEWDTVLREFVPLLWGARETDAYRLAMMRLIARVNDTHANLWSSLSVRPPRGLHRLPVKVRFIEGKAVVTGFLGDTLRRPSALRIGDVILTIGGERVDSLVVAWAPYYAASNHPTRLRDVAREITRGPPGPVRITGERDGGRFDLSADRILIEAQELRAQMTNDLPGEAFQMLTDEVAYLKLSSVSGAQSSEYIERAANAKVFVIDIRNYPREFVVFALGKHLVPRQTPFASFTIASGANPGTFVWRPGQPLQATPPHYTGSIVILVDEHSQSQAEYTAMAFRSAPKAIVVGSTTAGADGNVSPILLPGGLRSLISGIGVFYPDRRPTQRVGIIPDLVVRPTIAGIRQGRDEVLEAGVSRALGREFRMPARGENTVSGGAIPVSAASSSNGVARDALAEYQGIYAYHGNSTLALVGGTTLVAVIDEAKYPLRWLGRDRFLNGVGDTIPFRRGPDGAITGFVERTTFFPRRSGVVPPETIALVHARPRGTASQYNYAAPRDLSDGLVVGGLGDSGFDPTDIERLIKRVVDGTYPDVHSVLLYRRGKLVLEEYFYGYDHTRPHQLRSLTKSVISALAGIAIDRGLLTGEQELVTRHLPYDQYANPDPRKASLTLRDLLTMQSGLACNDWDQKSPGNESRMYESADWVKFVLDLPMVERPGTVGHYCSGAALTTGRIVERVAGKPLPLFAQQELFDPLGIRAADVRWDFTLSSSNAANFGGLRLRPRDMLKLGVLYQQQGTWRGRRIISREWVEKSLAPSSTIGDQRYGYLWWHQWLSAATPGSRTRVDMMLATGNGGQKIYLVPSLDMVVVLTGGSFNTDRSPTTELMVNEILPAALRTR